MGRLELALVLLLCYIAVTQSQAYTTIRVNSSDVSSRSQEGSPKTGRAIDSSSKSTNRFNSAMGDEEDDEIENLENSPPIERDNTEIHFPDVEEEVIVPSRFRENITTPKPNLEMGTRNGFRKENKATPKYDPKKWKTIPLEEVIKLGRGTEVNLETIFEKYVANARLVRNNETQEVFLEDNNGRTLYNSKNEKIVIKPATQMKTLNFSPHARIGPASAAFTPSTRALPAAHKDFDKPPVVPDHLDDTANRELRKPSSVEKLCIPEYKSMPVPITVEPHVFIIPKCVRVEQCGGCCLSDKLACEPSSTETVEVMIRKFAYIGGDAPNGKSLEYLGDEQVKVERHNSCECKCKTKAENCNSFQFYDERECDCVCKNQSAYEECRDDERKIWDKDSCMCTCREIRECSSGLYYNLNTCSCEV